MNRWLCLVPRDSAPPFPQPRADWASNGHLILAQSFYRLAGNLWWNQGWQLCPPSTVVTKIGPMRISLLVSLNTRPRKSEQFGNRGRSWAEREGRRQSLWRNRTKGGYWASAHLPDTLYMLFSLKLLKRYEIGLRLFWIIKKWLEVRGSSSGLYDGKIREHALSGYGGSHL